MSDRKILKFPHCVFPIRLPRSVCFYMNHCIIFFSFFRYEFDTDHTVYQLNILHALTQEPLGVINWFAVHPTSMNNTNHLISGDNKGLASQLLERHVNQGNDVSILAKLFLVF